ncbi:hypothetical protein DFJ58DRAFT_845208 [Suillus subalutaceus]|uniref:uncharacterized protein n=1 Tax=Suillus subalutaceus TaxID=48586 RepID=UPI001B866C1C|nr:uncharacterized protein DFJ58DRAFT_845208 [Suillus subalutaceus]KAG1840939.1 hypothetical protein DFJ58DRAFT_845208 [Suillus subalutaceus]
MQCSRLRKGTRKANKWNAFVKKEVEHHNAALPASEKHHKACELMSEIHAHWQEMDEDQRTIKTQDIIETLTELVLVLNSSYLVYEEIQNIRISLTFSTRLAQLSSLTIASRLQLACLHFASKAIVLQVYKLQAAAAPAQAQRMYYTNFDTSITAKYRMVLEKWPLSKFCCPGDISSCNELRVLYHAWNTNTMCFQRLSDVKFEDWENGRDVDEDNNSTPPVPSPSPPFTEIPTSTADIQSQPLSALQSRKWPGEELNGVFSVSGEAMPVQKRARCHAWHIQPTDFLFSHQACFKMADSAHQMALLADSTHQMALLGLQKVYKEPNFAM